MKFPAKFFFLQFLVIKPWIRIRIRNPETQLEKIRNQDPYPDPREINADPKPWFKVERGAEQPQARGVAHHLRAQEVITS